MNQFFTIGHSTHSIEHFIKLLRLHGIGAVADVRSHPYSKHFPQYSKEFLRNSLARENIAYVFLGKELGARSENPACYHHGKVQYESLAREPVFAQGLERVRQGMRKYEITLMCAEKDPLDCHRAMLVARRLFETGAAVQHIHADGHLESHQALEERMLQLHKMSADDMFLTRDEIMIDAYRIHGERIAYQDEAMLQDEIRSGRQ